MDDDPILRAGGVNDVVIQQPGGPPPPHAFPDHGYPVGAGGVPLGNMATAPTHAHAHNTTVIINQPGHMTYMGPREWSSSICSCCDDMGTCLLGAFCPWILACQVAMDMDESACVPCCVPGWLIVLRSKLRTQHNISGTVMDDCCITCCCGPCVMCQMAREIKNLRMVYSPQM